MLTRWKLALTLLRLCLRSTDFVLTLVRGWTKEMSMNFFVKDTFKLLAYGLLMYAIPLTLYWTFVE
jgi:hypothetical protein